MSVDAPRNKSLLPPLFFQEFESLDANDDLTNYYLLFHSKNGFSLQRKHSSWGIFSSIIDPIVRVWKACFGYSYAFEENVKKLTNSIDREWKEITDTKACVKSCRALEKIADRVLQKKRKDASELIENLYKTLNQFLKSKANYEHITPLEILSKCELFEEAGVLIAEGVDTAPLSNVSKNKLLGYFLNKRDIAVVERLLVQGADPNSQSERFFHLLPTLLHNKSSAISCYYLNLTRNKLEFVKDDIVRDLPTTVLKSMTKETYLYAYQWQVFDHNSRKFMQALRVNSAAVEDVQACVLSCRALLQILERRQIKNIPAELANLLHVTQYEYLANRAAVQNITTLELACRLELFPEAQVLIDDGADIGALSQESKDKYFCHCVETEQFDEAIQLLVFGANPASCKEKLRPFLAHCITQKQVEFALQLLDAGVDRGSSRPNQDDSALILATKQGLLVLVKKLASMGDNLRVRLQNQDTLLHIAAKNRAYDVLEWLSEKLDVGAKSQEKVPYFYIQNHDYFISKDPLERAFLLNDDGACAKILGYLQKDKAAECLAILRKKYPVSCVDHILYTVNKNHFQNKQPISLPVEVAPGCQIAELLELYDGLNFSRAEANDYINPADFQSDTGTTDPYRLRCSLDDFLHKVRHRVAYLGTPRAGSEALETFYHAIERSLTHTIHAIKNMPESDQKKAVLKRTVIEYLRAARYCGGKLYANAYQQYVAVTRGVKPTFKDEIIDALGNYREVLFQTLVPRGEQSVHDFNFMMRHLGIELGIPGAEMMESFEDIYIGHGVDLNVVRRMFTELYSPRNIVFECVKQQLEQSSDMRGKLIDWFKLNLPQKWQLSEFQRIRQEVAARFTDVEKKKYLETLEIYVAPNQSIEEAIEDERKARYLATEVVVNMEAPKMEIKPEAVAYMLQQMDVLKPVYDWTYYGSVVDMGKNLAKSAWSGTKNVLRAFFIR